MLFLVGGTTQVCVGEPGQDARVANPIRNQGSTDQNCFCPCPPHFSPHGAQPHSRHSTFSPVSVTISNGPYINLPVKVWGPSSLAMVSFILWLAVTFCTNQEGKEKNQPNVKKNICSDGQPPREMPNITGQTEAWVSLCHSSPPLHPQLSALEKNVTCGRGDTLCPALMGWIGAYMAEKPISTAVCMCNADTVY